MVLWALYLARSIRTTLREWRWRRWSLSNKDKIVRTWTRVWRVRVSQLSQAPLCQCIGLKALLLTFSRDSDWILILFRGSPNKHLKGLPRVSLTRVTVSAQLWDSSQRLEAWEFGANERDDGHQNHWLWYQCQLEAEYGQWGSETVVENTRDKEILASWVLEKETLAWGSL